MMKSVVFVALLCAVALAIKTPLINQNLVDTINEQGLWRADFNKGSRVHGRTFEEVKSLCGVKEGGPELPPRFYPDNVVSDLPKRYNAAEAYPQCTSITTIRDQSSCGSCFAFAAAEAMSDRICIKYNKNVTISPADIAFCCSSCGFGCQGGYPSAVWNWYKSTGVVEEGCYPYPFPACDHTRQDPTQKCPPSFPTPKCPQKCTNESWDGPVYSQDRHKSSTSYSLKGAENIMADIMKNGPVEAGFKVYEDFIAYKSGVYRYTTGRYLGGHAVKIFGWDETEDGTPYWIIANSWNYQWGNQGFFWMLRGKDECGIESMTVTGGDPIE